MADYNATDLRTKIVRVGDEGNGFNESFSYTHPTGGIASGSKIYYGIIPAGVEINACKKNNDANTTSYTESLGYEPVNSTDGPTAAATYWVSAGAAASAGSTVSTAHPIVFNFPVYVVGTTGGATSTAASKSSVTTNGKVVGTP